MQINLSEQTAALAREQAELSGYGSDVGAYLSHLIVANIEPPPAVPSPNSREELVEMLQEGLASGIAERSWDDLMRNMKQRIAARMDASKS